MPKITILFGLILIALGMYGYFGAPGSETKQPAAEAPADGAEATADAAEAEPGKKTSITALIPAFVGAPLLLCGLVALGGGKVRMHAMHGAAMLGLLGALAALGRGLSKIGALLSGDPDLNRRAVYMTLTMGAICVVYTVICVQSFIAARKAREAKEAAESKPAAE